MKPHFEEQMVWRSFKEDFWSNSLWSGLVAPVWHIYVMHQKRDNGLLWISTMIEPVKIGSRVVPRTWVGGTYFNIWSGLSVLLRSVLISFSSTEILTLQCIVSKYLLYIVQVSNAYSFLFYITVVDVSAHHFCFITSHVGLWWWLFSRERLWVLCCGCS